MGEGRYEAWLRRDVLHGLVNVLFPNLGDGYTDVYINIHLIIFLTYFMYAFNNFQKALLLHPQINRNYKH